MNRPDSRFPDLRAATPWLCGALAAAAMCLVFGVQTVGLLPLLLVFGLGLAFRHAPDAAGADAGFGRRIDLLAALFALCLLAGAYERMGLTRAALATPTDALLAALKTGVAVCGGFLLFRCLLHWLFAALLRVRPDAERDVSRRAVRRVFLCSAAVLLVCYLPAFIAEFPGVLTPDSVRQMRQVMELEPLSNKHPLVHTLMIKGCYQLGQALFHTVTGGVAMYTAVQVLCVALTLGYSVSVLYGLGAPRWMPCALLAFFGLSVCHGGLAVTMWKDIPFALLLLLLSIRLLLMTRGERPRPRDWVLFSLIGLGVCLFRFSGLIAFVLLTPFALCAFRGRDRTNAAICCGAVLVCSYLALVPLMRGMDAAQPDAAEALSVPAQQIARLFYEQTPLDEADVALLDRVVDTGRLAEAYAPLMSDPVKSLIRERGAQSLLRERAWDYIRLYLRLGCRYPGVYARAYIEQTRGFYAPTMDIMPLAFGVAENDCGIPDNAPLPGSLRSLLRQGAFYLCRAPVYAALFSLGLYTFLLLCGMALAGRRKRPLLPSLPALFNLAAILIGTPLAGSFRYGYFLLLIAPFLLFAYSVRQGE